MKLTRIKQGPRSMGMSIINDSGEARYVIFMGNKNGTINEFHTNEGDNLPMWNESNLLGGNTPTFVFVNLSEYLDGETEVIPIPEDITEATAISVWLNGQRQFSGFNYSLDIEHHTLTTLYGYALSESDFLAIIIGGDVDVIPSGVPGPSGKSPYINGTTGNWMTYDDSTKTWIDTGVPAPGINDVKVNGSSVVVNGVADIALTAENIFYDNEHSGLDGFNIQEAIDQLDVEMRYNSILPLDVTAESAPPNMPRGYNWHIDISAPLQNSHQYSRYFYSSVEDSMLDTTGNPNISDAVAHWVIDGKHIYFEYLSNGTVNTIIDITDINGDVVNSPFRPIPIGEVWFFGEIQLDPFPQTESIKSILDINVGGLFTMLGNTFDLDTQNKEIVAAINEINSKPAMVDIYEAQDAASALTYSQNNPNTFVFVAKQ